MKTILELREEAIKEDKNPEFYLYQKLEEITNELQRKDNIINDLKSSIADYQEAVGDYQNEMIIKDNNWNELKEFILNHYIVGHTVQNGSLDMIINKMKELEK